MTVNYCRTELKAERRIDAVRALAAFGTRGHLQESVAAIAEMVKEYDLDDMYVYEGQKPTPDAQVIQEAKIAIKKMGSAGFEALLPFVKDRKVRGFAAGVYHMTWVGESWVRLSPAGVRTLIGLVAAESPGAAAFAAAVLRQAAERDSGVKEGIVAASKGPDALKFLHGLAQALTADELMWGSGPVDTLKLVRDAAKPIVPELVAILNGPCEQAKHNAVRALTVIGPDGGEALPVLGRLAADKHDLEMFRIEAVQAIGTIATAAKPPPIAEFLRILADEDDETGVRIAVIEALQQSEAGRREAVPVLAHVLESRLDPERDRGYKDDKIIESCLHYLAGAGEKAKTSVPVLKKVLKSVNRHYSPDDVLRFGHGIPNPGQVHERFVGHVLTIINVLGEVGPDAKDALPEVRYYLSTTDKAARRQVEAAIRQIDRT